MQGGIRRNGRMNVVCPAPCELCAFFEDVLVRLVFLPPLRKHRPCTAQSSLPGETFIFEAVNLKAPIGFSVCFVWFCPDVMTEKCIFSLKGGVLCAVHKVCTGPYTWAGWLRPCFPKSHVGAAL